MTVTQLRDLLARLPAECAAMPVSFHWQQWDVECAGVQIEPPGMMVHYPDGTVTLLGAPQVNSYRRMSEDGHDAPPILTPMI